MAIQSHIDIQKLYVAYFNRPADVDGLNYWADVVARTGNTSAISAAFAGSDEYKAAYAGMSPSAVVVEVYKNLFGTSPDRAGLNFWASKLADGTLSVDLIVQNIAAGAQGADAKTYANKVTAATAFTEQLDTAAEIIGYAKPNASAAAKAFISSITTDATLAAAMAPATLAATVANVIQASNAGTSFGLTTNQDFLTGTDGNDTFVGRIFDNSNTLQSGDVINGGAGTDRLNADIGNSQDFAITPETTGIEIVSIRAQAQSYDDADNNTSRTNEVQIDAQRMVGVNQWESSNSRADLLIEDVRILDSQITKDITVAMVETDPGHVDFGVYFDQYSLRSQTNSTSVLRLQLMDTRSAAANLDPLLESPYNGFAFYYDGVLKTVQSPAIDAATTYAQLLVAITDAVKAAGLDDITVSLGGSFTVNDTLGTPLQGTEILLTSTSGSAINEEGDGAGWLAAGAVPPSSGLHTNMSTQGDSSVDPVTVKVILDDVGRGSMGGDLVIGGMSTGYTSESKGVERFEIEVRDNSKLQTVSSTNNTLKEIVIKNGVTTSSDHAYVKSVKDAGNLTITGSVDALNGFDSQNGVNTPLPGQESVTNGYGLTDVRLIDASAMVGKLDITAAITANSIGKYINVIDTQVAPNADNINFQYTGGSNNDKIDVTIDGNVAASNSLLMVGREDFTFTTSGGAGDDTITVRLVDGIFGDGNGGTLPGAGQAWYANQAINANVTINGGDGNDTIWTPGAGNVVINAGAGDDTVYADNTGFQEGIDFNGGRAAYVFNAAAVAGNAYNIYDLQSQAASSVSAVNAQLTVNFRGLTETVTIANSMNSLTNVSITDLHINQAIKEAINKDPVLNKLLVAEDGPSRTLIVRSLIDGVQVASDLAVTFSSTTLSAAQLAFNATAPATALVQFSTASNALLDGYLTTNFANHGDGGIVATPAVAEVQTMDFADITVAAGESLTFNIGGGQVSFLNETNADLTGAALVAEILELNTGVSYDLTATGTVVSFTQTTGSEANIAPITATNSDTEIPVVTAITVTEGAAAVAAGGTAIVGADSVAVSDNTITGGTGNDVIVLGTNNGVDGGLATVASNDTIVYAAGVFGNDTIVNFEATGAGADVLNFTALGGSGAAFGQALSTTNRSITVVAETTANDALAEVLALYTTAITDANTAVKTHVYVAYDAANVATVYSITDAIGAGGVTAVEVGTIDLADTAWNTLTGGNFTGGTFA